MEQNRPQKVGEYERPARASNSTAMTVGVIILIIALIVLAIIVF